MIKTIDKYIFKQLFLHIFFISLAFCGVILLSQSLKLLDITVNDGASLTMFGKLILLSLPKFFVVILPIALLIATVSVYAKLLSDNEIIILKSSGLSNIRLSVAAICLGTLVSIFVFMLDGWIVPLSKLSIEKTKRVIVNEQASVLLKENIFNDLKDGLSVYVDKKHSSDMLEGIFIKDGRVPEKEQVIIAKQGFLNNKDGVVSLTLVDGMTQYYQEEKGKLENLKFKQYNIELKKPKNNLLNFMQKDVDERGLIDLFKYLKKDNIDNRLEIIGSINSKISTIFLTITFAIIGMACILGGKFKRTGYTLRIVFCFLCVIVLQGISMGLLNLSKDYLIANVFMYIFTIVPGTIAFYFISKAKEKNVIRQKIIKVKNTFIK